MSFKFSSGQTIDTYRKVLLHRVEKKLYPNLVWKFPCSNDMLQNDLLSKSNEKKSKENFVLEIRSISQGGGGEEERGICIRAKRREPGFKRLRSRLQLAISFTRNTDAITQWSSNGNSRDKPGRGAACMHANFGRVG